MKREDLTDLAAFVAVAEERSFTRAAARLGMSQPALSYAIKVLENRLGIRLLARTTRSVGTTEAGQRLLETLRPAFDTIGAELQALRDAGGEISGNLRITMVKHAATSLVLPRLGRFLADHPKVSLELNVDDALVDIVAERFDAGLRVGASVEKDMIAVPIGPQARAAVVATPDYFARNPPPRSPRDLDRHDCINYRLASAGGFLRWRFHENGHPLDVRVEGSLVVNDGDVLLACVLDGQGLGYLFEDHAAEHIRSGRLVRVLEDWCRPFPGFHLYYPSRHQKSAALAAFIEALRR
jgi:DNA-binding transcriptional LysR family regulator